MNIIRDFFRKRKLIKEINKHDKSYIDKKYIYYDKKTGMPYHNFNKKIKKSVDKFNEM